MTKMERVNFTLTKELKHQIIDFCETRNEEEGCIFTVSDFCRAAVVEYLNKYRKKKTTKEY